MSKIMARIQNGVVTNVEVHSDNVSTSDVLVPTNEALVSIGDSYVDGKFYRDGSLVLTEIETMQKKISEYSIAFSEIESTLGTPAVGGTMDTIVNARKQAILSRINEMMATLANN